MDTDRPSQEGRKDVPSELSFLVSAPEADPTPVCDAFERGDSGHRSVRQSRLTSNIGYLIKPLNRP